MASGGPPGLKADGTSCPVVLCAMREMRVACAPPWLPDWTQTAVAWMLQPIVLTLFVITSVLLFVVSLVALPVVLAWLPTDFFSRPEGPHLRLAERRRPVLFVIVLGLKNLLGSVFLVLGLLMLILPGQGLLSIWVALLLLDFPGKRRLERWVILRPTVHRPVNALRRRAGRPPLQLPARHR